MASKIFYKSSVERDLKDLDRPTAARLLARLEEVLSARPHTGKPIHGEFQGLFSLRIGDYRIVYSKVADGVLVVRIGHRRNVYR